MDSIRGVQVWVRGGGRGISHLKSLSCIQPSIGIGSKYQQLEAWQQHSACKKPSLCYYTHSYTHPRKHAHAQPYRDVNICICLCTQIYMRVHKHTKVRGWDCDFSPPALWVPFSKVLSPCTEGKGIANFLLIFPHRFWHFLSTLSGRS